MIYNYLVVFNHFGHASSHTLAMIKQICNFCGSLTTCQKNNFIAQLILEMQLTQDLA